MTKQKIDISNQIKVLINANSHHTCSPGDYAMEMRGVLTNKRFVTCPSCGGEGRALRGHPNDPHPKDYGVCPTCEGWRAIEIDTQPIENGGFDMRDGVHWSRGMYFRRQQDGTVEVIQTVNGGNRGLQAGRSRIYCSERRLRGPHSMTEQAATWQPIELAPKDGRRILIGRLDAEKTWRCCVVRWKFASWYAGRALPEGNLLVNSTSTHWHPLPEPPTFGEKVGEK